MSKGIDVLWQNIVEKPLLYSNLLFSPAKRAVVFGVGSALALWAFKPKGLFNEDGTPKDLQIIGNFIPVHWTTVSGFVAGASVLFI